MSRQLRKRPGRNKQMIAAMLVLLISLGFTGYYYYTTQQENTSEEVIIETATIGTGDISLSATGSGTLIPEEEVSFGFKNSGKVSLVLVSLGDQVQAGQVLARLESKTLELEYQQVVGNLAALSSPAEFAVAEQAVQDAMTSFATARNDLEYLIGPEMLFAEENVTNAQAELEKAKAAAEQDASDQNKQKVLDAEAALDKAQEALTWVTYAYASNYTVQTFTYPVRNDHGITIRKELSAPSDAEISSARAAYNLAKANLEDAQAYLAVLSGAQTADEVPASSLSILTEAKLALEQAKANLDATELIAPISGTITSIDLNVGDSVGTLAVMTLSNMSQPYVIDAYLDETDWDKAKVGYTATVTFDLLPDESYSGKVIQVYPVLDDSSDVAMVHIQVQLDEAIDADLPMGSSTSVDVTGGEALGAVLVPVSALKEVEPRKYIVYLLQNDAPIEQSVEIGLQDLLYAEVKSGLQVGDIVLTDATVNK